MARRELRGLRQQAREGTKLLEDKKALEQKVHELQAMLETVQDQRNELRQQVGCWEWESRLDVNPRGVWERCQRSNGAVGARSRAKEPMTQVGIG